MKSVLLSLFAPAGAIVGGALLQLALTSVWPQIQRSTIANVSVDSYIAIAAILILSFWVGRILSRRAPARPTVLISLIVPFVWFVAVIRTLYWPVPLSFNTLSVDLFLTASAPLFGLLLAYSLPSNQRLERP
jgi:hypothetical protein